MSASRGAGVGASTGPACAAFEEPIDLVIFDCDGVLFESRGANVAFYNEIFVRMGLAPMDAGFERLCHHAATRQLFERRFGGDLERMAEAVRVAREVDYTPFYDHMIPMEGLFDVLAHVGQGRSMAMATNRTRTASGVIERFGLGTHLTFLASVRDGVRPKPAPDMLHECLEHFGTAPERALFVGDAESDRLAAAAAGVSFLGLGAVPGAERCVERFAELVHVVPSRPRAAPDGLTSPSGTGEPHARRR